ncbi:MAG: hypothetical protein N3B13_03840 [Deltaproteobacteria bacterium]|nr:hypothetical protein [Deltaproteobacteria bacterium]
MRRFIIITAFLVSVTAALYSACHQERENLKIVLSFQHQEEGVLNNFIEKYANKLIVSVYGNNMTPVKKSIDFPSSPEWVCLHDGGYYKPDSEGYTVMDIHFPPNCDYGDRQFAKIVVSVSVPVGTNRSVVVETVGNDGNVAFRGSVSDIIIEEDTSVNIAINPIARIGFSVFEITDIKNSKYETANTGTLRAYYFERGKVTEGERKNYATLLGEQSVSKDKKAELEFAYSGQYSEYDYQNHTNYFYPSLFGYYKGENGAISFVIPGLAESFGFGLEPGKSYEMAVYAALREKIRTNPILSAVTPSQANYTYYEDMGYGKWDWMYGYVSYIHSLPESSVKIIRLSAKTDISEDVVTFSTSPVEPEKPFPNEVYDIGRLKNIEDEFYMGFRNLPLPDFSTGMPAKTSGTISVWMEFETYDGNKFKTNKIDVKYNIIKTRYTSPDAGSTGEDTQ